jgi:hypothetical protein
VRLGTCIALELVVAVGAAGGVWLGVGHATELAANYLTTHEAAAATSVVAGRTPVRLPEARLATPPPALPLTVFAASDGELLAPLGTAALTRAKINRQGTSLSLRLDFASGGRAAFKPEQTHPQSDPRREIAAYRIDRLLAIGHVPPAKAVVLRLDDLIAAAEPNVRGYMAQRLADEAIVRDGRVRGEVSWWIPEIRNARLGPYELDERDGMNRWRTYLQVGGLATVAPELRAFVAQIATVVVFDVLIDNADRWSGSNTKVSGDRSILYFMDNTLSFSPFTLGHEANLKPLRAIQVFPRQLIARVRALSYESLVAALGGGDDSGLAPLLTPVEIRAILARRDHVIRHIDWLIAELGEDKVLALP